MRKERFGVAVEEGTVAKLRTLAGGERRVGAFLSELVHLLWAHRPIIESIAARKAEGASLRDLVLLMPDQVEEKEESIKILTTEILVLDDQVLALAERQERMDRDLAYFRAVIESAEHLEGVTLEEYQARRQAAPQGHQAAPDATGGAATE